MVVVLMVPNVASEHPVLRHGMGILLSAQHHFHVALVSQAGAEATLRSPKQGQSRNIQDTQRPDAKWHRPLSARCRRTAIARRHPLGNVATRPVVLRSALKTCARIEPRLRAEEPDGGYVQSFRISRRVVVTCEAQRR